MAAGERESYRQLGRFRRKRAAKHFMIKEIHEEPRAMADTFFPRYKDGIIDLSRSGLTNIW